MKTITGVTLYKCDFCPKVYRAQHFAINHEAQCTKNPANERLCFGCQHLSKENETVYTYGYDGSEHERTKTFLRCGAKEIWLYPPKVEHKQNQDPDLDDNHPMPKECEDYKPQEYF